VAVSLNLNKLPWYGQVGLFAVLSAMAAGAFYYLYASDKMAAIDAQRGQLASLRAEINTGLKTAKRLPEFRQEVTKLEAQLDRLRAVLPEEQDVADLLRRVQGMATQSNLAIRGFTPQTVSKKTMHAEWPIGLKLEGTYHDLGAFLERVSKFPRIINVGNIKIKARDQQSSAATVDAECTATTFVLLDQKAAAPAKPGPGGRGAVPPAAAPKKTE